MKRITLYLQFLAALALTACTPPITTSTEVDAVMDGGPDATPDAAPDAAPDAPTDAAIDAAIDAAPDAPPDAYVYTMPSTLPDTTGRGHAPATVIHPAGPPPPGGWALVIAFHELGGHGSDVLGRLNLNDLGTKAVVVLPDGLLQGTITYWDAGPECCNYAGHTGPYGQDVAYGSALITGALAGYPIDPARINVTGYSNGDFEAEAVAHADPRVTRLSGFGGASPNLGATSWPLAILRFHGDADTTIKFIGGRFQSMPATYPAQLDATADGCTSFTNTGVTKDYNASVAGAETTIYQAAGCPTGTTITEWSMHNVTHVTSFNAAERAAVEAFMLN